MALSNIQWRFAQPTEYKNINAYRDNVMQNISGIINGVREFHDNRIDAENASLIDAEEKMEKQMEAIDERLPNIDLELENVRNQIKSIETSMQDIEGKFYDASKPEVIENDGMEVV